MRRKNKIINVIISLVLGVLTVFGLFACNKAPAPEVEPEEQAAQSVIQSITLDEAPELTATRGVNQKTVTASVEPVDAPNRTLSWELFWISNPFGENAAVSSYVVIENISENTFECTVKALRDFEGAVIGLQAESVVGKVTAVCQIEYDGRPTIDGWKNNGVIISSFPFEIEASLNATFTWAPTSSVGQIGSKYCKKENVTIKGIYVEGSFRVQHTRKINGTIELDQEESLSILSSQIDKYISCEFNSNGELVVTAKKSISSYLAYVDLGHGDYEQKVYKSGYDNVTFTIEVEDSASGFIGDLDIRIIPGPVTRVTLNPATLTF